MEFCTAFEEFRAFDCWCRIECFGLETSDFGEADLCEVDDDAGEFVGDIVSLGGIESGPNGTKWGAFDVFLGDVGCVWVGCSAVGVDLRHGDVLRSYESSQRYFVGHLVG